MSISGWDMALDERNGNVSVSELHKLKCSKGRSLSRTSPPLRHVRPQFEAVNSSFIIPGRSLCSEFLLCYFDFGILKTVSLLHSSSCIHIPRARISVHRCIRCFWNPIPFQHLQFSREASDPGPTVKKAESGRSQLKSGLGGASL